MRVLILRRCNCSSVSPPPEVPPSPPEVPPPPLPRSLRSKQQTLLNRLQATAQRAFCSSLPLKGLDKDNIGRDRTRHSILLCSLRRAPHRAETISVCPPAPKPFRCPVLASTERTSLEALYCSAAISTCAACASGSSVKRTAAHYRSPIVVSTVTPDPPLHHACAAEIASAPAAWPLLSWRAGRKSRR